MSWSLNLIGKKSAIAAKVKAQLVDNGNAPAIGNAIIGEINAIPDQSPGFWGADSVRVLGSGHTGGGISELKVEPFCYENDVPGAPPSNPPQ